MRKFILAVGLILVFIFIVPIVQLYITKFLAKLDERKDYSNYSFKIIKNQDTLKIEYLVWELNKLKAIKSKYDNKITYNNTEYCILSYKEDLSVNGKLYFNKYIEFIVQEIA